MTVILVEGGSGLKSGELCRLKSNITSSFAQDPIKLGRHFNQAREYKLLEFIEK